MAPEAAIANTAMEGGGFYNRNSNLQAAGIELALPLLMKAACAIPVTGGGPLVVVDYGCSQGKNSMRPMRLAIENLRARAGADRCIEVVHTDLPSNDFASLFTTLQEDGGSYLAGQANVFPAAIGRSYFEPILPAGRVHLGWNTWTLHWLSRSPGEISDHVLVSRTASADILAAVNRQKALDWESFLKARSSEMADGAHLVTMSVGARLDVGGWDWIFDTIWQSAVSMEKDGLLSRAELTRFTVPTAGRTLDDLKAPFADGPFQGLALEHAEVVQAPDPFWDEFQQTGDAAKLGRQWAGTMRAATGPVAAAAFASRPNCGALMEELYRRMEAGIAGTPQQNIHFLAIAMLRKRPGGEA